MSNYLETVGQAISDDYSSFSSSIGVIGHLWGQANGVAVGLYGGVDFPSLLTIYTVGGEAEAYLGAATLGANIDYNWIEICCGSVSFWTARTSADLYVMPNARIGAEVSYSSGGANGLDPNNSSWGVVVDAEYRIAETQVSAWVEGRYDYAGVTCTGDCNGDILSAMIGARVFMDAAGTTLNEHDKAVPWNVDVWDYRVFR